MGKQLTLTACPKGQYYRISSDAHPLYIEVGPATVTDVDAGHLDASVVRGTDGAIRYEQLIDVDRHVQRALADVERQRGRFGALMPLVSLPRRLDDGPGISSAIHRTTQVWEKPPTGRNRRSRLTPRDIAVGTTVHLIVDLVGVRSVAEHLWQYETVVKEVLVLPPAPSPSPPPIEAETIASMPLSSLCSPAAPAGACPFADDADLVSLADTESHHELPDAAAATRASFGG